MRLMCRLFDHAYTLRHVEGPGARLVLFGGLGPCRRCGSKELQEKADARRAHIARQVHEEASA